MENEMQWVKLSDRKPEINGLYLVCYSHPYEEKMGLDVKYFYNGYFDNETSGANYIAFWLDGVELPYLDKKERQKLCK